MTVGTTCKVHCLNPYEKFDPTLLAHSFFAHCQRDGSWEYQPEKPTCLGKLFFQSNFNTIQLLTYVEVDMECY